MGPTEQPVRRFAGWAAPHLRRAQRRWAGFSVGAVARRAVGCDAPGTEGAAAPFWSPDSRFIAFFSDGKLKKIDSSGGPPMTLCEAPGDYPTGSWGSEHSILFAAATQPFISLVAEGGGAPSVVLKADASRQERAVRAPSFLPDGRHFLTWRPARREAALCPPGEHPEGKTGPLLTNCSRAEYVPGDPNDPAHGRSGYLLYAIEGNLLAQHSTAGSYGSSEIPSRGAGDLATRAHRRRPLLRVQQRCPRLSGRGKPARLVWIDGPAGRRVPSPRQPDSNRCGSLPTPEESSSAAPAPVRA
jgi:hypothetical protein